MIQACIAGNSRGPALNHMIYRIVTSEGAGEKDTVRMAQVFWNRNRPGRGVRKLHVYLIKPTLYDEDGYVVRHWRGVLPSNTLACLAGLTEDIAIHKRLGKSVKIELHVLDETVDRVPVRRICRSQRGQDTRTVVGLVGVQTNQFPRAADLARTFRRAGLTVMIGGFHVTGYLSLLPSIPREIQELTDEGVTIVMGEVEAEWTRLLRDAVTGCLKPLYNFIHEKPDLADKPLPVIRKEYLRKFIASNFGTLDCGRGCPFACSFCTVINVQGRTMRFRSAERIADTLRHNYVTHGISFYFFTDDNFARNKSWEAIFDALIRLRENEHIPIEFMIQADVLSWKIKNFVQKARRAGCTSVFIGMESLNEENLKAAGKSQNHVEEYSQLMDCYRNAEISTHVGYIIGFPNDTVDSVHRDLDRLIHQVRPDHASFFMLTPLPGSQDHITLLRSGDWMDPDFNRYDSWHAVSNHRHLKRGEWSELYQQAWRIFYSFDNMKAILRRAPQRDYWSNLFRFIWYKNSFLTEGRHPMMCGFFRLKGRKNRRPGFQVATRREYVAQRVKEVGAHLAGMLRLLFEMEELWLATRKCRSTEQQAVDELAKISSAVHGRIGLDEIQLAYRRAKSGFCQLRVPSKIELFEAKWCPMLASRRILTRADLDSFWLGVMHSWRKRQWLRVPWLRAIFELSRDLQLGLIFFAHLARAD